MVESGNADFCVFDKKLVFSTIFALNELLDDDSDHCEHIDNTKEARSLLLTTVM